jgi:hypothetical protein
MSVQILFRRGTAADWTTANPILGSGEPGFETDTGLLKIGDGSSDWNSLSYVSGSSSVSILEDLTNVSINSPTTGQVLKFDGTNWINDTDLNTGTLISSIDDIPNVSINSPTTGQVLKFDGTNWINDTDLNTGTGALLLNDITDVVLTTPTNGQVLKFDGTNWINGIDDSLTTSGLDELIDVIITSPTSGQVLKYNGSFWINSTDDTGGTSISSINDIPDVVLTTPTAGQVLKYNGTEWVNDSDNTGGGALPTRTSLVGSTGSLANGASGPINLTGFSTYVLMKIQTSTAAWVRIYTSEAARLADNARLQGEDPLPGSGVIAEVVTTGPETVLISPGTIGFNNEDPVTTNIPMRVTNLSGGSATITVTLTAIQLEA